VTTPLLGHHPAERNHQERKFPMANAEATEVVDARVVDEPPPPVPDLGALVPMGGKELAVTPQVQATELVERLDVIKQAQTTAMEAGVDYGAIPGTGSKPTLLKPGAEKLSVLFQLDVQLVNEKTWGPGDHLTVTSKATVFHAPTGARLGFGEGLCTTREKKYGKRKQDRSCPDCGEATIKKSKFPPRSEPGAEPGWYCFAKLGGCGKEFAASDPQIVEQPVGEVENPDLPDLWNTVVKMAEKRARVDAVLAVTGASALFTQDVEDAEGSLPEQAGTESFQRASTEAHRPKLDAARVAKLTEGIKALKLPFSKINKILGAVGANSLSERSAEGVTYALESLTTEQADAFDARLEAEAAHKGSGGNE
jgi:hypothetical protein